MPAVKLVRVPAPSPPKMAGIVDRVRRYAARQLRRRGLLSDGDELSSAVASAEARWRLRTVHDRYAENAQISAMNHEIDAFCS